MKSSTISVIITAHSRKEFLIKAIESALAQTLNKDLFEIIVVSNFDFVYPGIKCIRDDAESLGHKLVTAVEISEGDIITFLEDDDLYAKNRLVEIFKRFRTSQYLTYYGNELEFIDINGNPIHELTVKRENKLVKNQVGLFDEEIPSNLVLKKGIDIELLSMLWFNLSRIAVRKNLLEKNKEVIQTLNLSLDYFLFLLALSINANLYLSSNKLTLYRVHPSSSSYMYTESYKDKLIRWILDDKIIMNYFHDYRIHKVTQIQYIIHCLTLALLMNDKDKDYEVLCGTKEELIRSFIHLFNKNFLKMYILYKLLFLLLPYNIRLKLFNIMKNYNI